jgi:hypothetical protein
MLRHFFFAIALIGVGALNSSAQAVTDAAQCEDHFANCIGSCINPGAGVGDNRCLHHCDRRVTSCLVRAHEASFRCTRTRVGWRCP